MATETSERILIVGGGFAGCALAARLAQSGLPVTVLESSAHIGDQASTRNQGWLHSGGIFALERPELARLCYQSLEQTLAFCPDAIEPGPVGMLYIVSRPDTASGPWRRAWDQAGIPWSEVPHDEARQLLPGFDSSRLLQVFRLPDRSFRPDVLLEALAATARNAGAEIRLGAPVVRVFSDTTGDCGVELGGGEVLHASRIVLATGAVTDGLGGHWRHPPAGSQPNHEAVILKAHLISMRPELCRTPFCVVDADGFNHLPHLQTSVCGDSHWPVVQDPLDLSVDPAEVERLWGRVQEFFPEWNRSALLEQREWAGTVLQMLDVDQIVPETASLPTVVNLRDFAGGCPRVYSIHPGRATLWAQLAELARDRLLEDLPDRRALVATRPPWAVDQAAVEQR